MNQIILKRPANVSSQDALTQLALEYPESEILSFRRVKSGGLNGEYFVATLRIAEHDEMMEVEENEDEKLDKIISLIKQLIESDKEVHDKIENKDSIVDERPPVKNPMPMQPMANKTCECWDGYERVPGTKPCEPGSCKKCDDSRKKAMVVIERDANVSASRAKLELLKEFGKEYKIARLAKTGSIYSATLVKRADLREEQEAEMYEIWNNQAKLDGDHGKNEDHNKCDCCDGDDDTCACDDCHDHSTDDNDRWD